MSMLMNERTERQKTDLQRRKVSAAIKLERNHRSDQYLMKEEAVQQLEEEFEFVDKELRQLQQRAEGRKRRELESLRRFGAVESGRHSLPEIEITGTEEFGDTDDATSHKKHNRQSKGLLKALLNVSPLFQQKTRAVSAENLRILYTGKSEFYDDDSDNQDEVFQRTPSPQQDIDEDVLNEINLFKQLIENYFRSKRR